jgi:hypothetical protein
MPRRDNGPLNWPFVARDRREVGESMTFRGGGPGDRRFEKRCRPEGVRVVGHENLPVEGSRCVRTWFLEAAAGGNGQLVSRSRGVWVSRSQGVWVSRSRGVRVFMWNLWD